MLLKSLKLKDFRQFKGEQSINFAIDKNKNVTIILGENGSGKTSLAQAFTWCLYGKTDFDNPILLCQSTAFSMPVGSEESVIVSLSLIHNNINYIISSTQIYKKNNNGIQSVGQRKFEISYKNTDGQTEFLSAFEAEIRIKEILPVELSRYFFFDGERIGNMSKDLRKGKSREFSEAVRSLLGLSAYTEAMRHLKGQGASKSVLRSYDDLYDSKADSRISEYTQKIDQFNITIENIDKRLIEIENEAELTEEKIIFLNGKIKENDSSKELAEQRQKLINRRQTFISRRNNQTSEILKLFNKNATAYFSKKMMYDSLEQLTKSNKLDKSVPDIHARTIDYLINEGHCICGTEICVGNEAFNTLNRLREYIPPQSIGNTIEIFKNNCENNINNTITFFEDFKSKYADILSFENDYSENEDEINNITKTLEKMEDVGKLQADLTKYENQQRNLRNEKSQLDNSKGAAETSKERMETERHELTLRDKKNQRIEIFKTYAQYIYDYIQNEYTNEEKLVREKLSEAINEIFCNIYKGGFSLALDSKYNVQLIVKEHSEIDDVETSQSQSISIIFAFIAGVIKLARESQNPENEMLVSEPYPLVMDAPLSAFDKTRIKTVCTVLPEIAEQIIIFIKDTDGEIAEKYLCDKIGNRSNFKKVNEFETYIEGRNN